MASGGIGDDVYGEDPTLTGCKRWQLKCWVKKLALFVPSGTMGNLAAVLAHCGRG
jgi:threonine aldolase